MLKYKTFPKCVDTCYTVQYITLYSTVLVNIFPAKECISNVRLIGDMCYCRVSS